MAYLLRTQNTEALKKLVKKYGNKVPIQNQYVRGTFTVKNYRKYSFREEVDVEFNGEIHVMWARKRDWYDSSIMGKKDGKFAPSKIKVNRFIRKNIINSVSTHLRYFCVDVRCYSDILKIKWV